MKKAAVDVTAAFFIPIAFLKNGMLSGPKSQELLSPQIFPEMAS